MRKKKAKPSERASVTDPALVAILAALLYPKDLAVGNAAKAVSRAHKMIEMVPSYLKGRNLNLKEALTEFEAEGLRRNKEAKEWGFSEPLSIQYCESTKKKPEGEKLWEQELRRAGGMTFEEAISSGICEHHKTVPWLTKFLKAVEYPEAYLEMRVITKPGYQRALEKKKQTRRKKNTAQKKKSRANPV
jgi:hypothetical protein